MSKDDIHASVDAPAKRSWWIAAVAACWLAAAGGGLFVLWSYENAPGVAANAHEPSSFADGWEKTGLWEAATALPDATVLRDDDGLEAMRFGAVTSGQTMLYDASGTLLFSGGITGARGHAGDNEGRSAVVALLDRLETHHRTTNVFGCSLFRSAKS